MNYRQLDIEILKVLLYHKIIKIFHYKPNKYLYTENYKSLIKEMKEDITKGRDM